MSCALCWLLLLVMSVTFLIGLAYIIVTAPIIGAIIVGLLLYSIVAMVRDAQELDEQASGR